MNVLAFDGRMGAAGDMILGALIAAGADPDVLTVVEDAIGLTYEVDETTKNGLRATSVDVLVDSSGTVGSSGDRHPADHAEHRGHPTAKDHRSEVDHGHDDTDHDQHSLAEGAGPRRTYPEVVSVVESMGLQPSVETSACSIFELLGESEAAVHGTDLAETHFHEVGGDDAIADVVGAVLLIEDLSPERVVTTPLSAGGGEVATSHGRYPVPAPAVVEIASRADWSLRGGPVESELLTPTGAAILAHVAEGVETLPSIRVRATGYGAGDRDFPEHPNVLRTTVGDGGTGLTREGIRVLETNVDDVSPEVLGDLHEALSAAGARDVSISPLSMKKSRPGHLIRVIARPEDAERVARRLAVETGTLGVRETAARHRWVAEREVKTVEVDVEGTRYDLDVKVASDPSGAIFDVSAEYDDAAAVARETDVPVREVMRLAEAAFDD